MWGRGAYDLREGKARRVGGKGALDECGEHFGCSGVIPGGLEVQSLGKGLSSILTGGAAEKSMFSGLDILFAPKAEPRFWAVPIGVAQEVGGRQLHLEEACGCVTREGEDGRKLCGGGKGKVVPWFVPSLPFLEELAADLRA